MDGGCRLKRSIDIGVSGPEPVIGLLLLCGARVGRLMIAVAILVRLRDHPSFGISFRGQCIAGSRIANGTSIRYMWPTGHYRTDNGTTFLYRRILAISLLGIPPNNCSVFRSQRKNPRFRVNSGIPFRYRTDPAMNSLYT